METAAPYQVQPTHTLRLRDIARMAHVTRWHTVRTARDQTLAEHLYIVTMISHELARRVLGDRLTDQDRLAVYDWALRHDTPEIITGDVPTPTKHQLGKMYTDQSPLDLLEESVCRDFTEAKNRVRDTPLKILVKLADIAEAIVFLNVESVTDQGRRIQSRLHDQYRLHVQQAATRWPDHHWDAALAALDELLHGEETAELDWN
ncbi:MAG: YfbR-like 5'-deoxynucleotidase [Salinisphaeraceae bacterium]|uniref:YfbR-like 5'-deoxynucleotidase n=1 Tax=Spectribacter acetivorans TaxID=3075603 RepID=A0ABU3B9M6_9GAMM|nr:YfbR-like 5'-deoxynucleotidase [Salinisphaera sp. P385]MDT0618512.1 YfbR-like 5'-deoxynucleotidase [Salinisphaera sp. P385]